MFNMIAFKLEFRQGQNHGFTQSQFLHLALRKSFHRSDACRSGGSRRVRVLAFFVLTTRPPDHAFCNLRCIKACVLTSSNCMFHLWSMVSSIFHISPRPSANTTLYLVTTFSGSCLN